MTVSVGACARSDTPDSTFVTDSAGFRIVTSTTAAWGPEGGWRVDPTPFVDIGAEEGDPDGHLFRVRDAVRWRGRIVVINGVTDDLRVFDTDGAYQRTIGRQGGGPGEFRNLGFLRVLHTDSLLTWDFGNDRISVFDETGTFVRSTWLDHDDSFGSSVGPVDLLEGDRLLTVSTRSMLELGSESGRFVDSGLLALHDLDGRVDTILGLHPVGERMRMAYGDRITTLGAPFARELHGLGWRGGYCLGFATRFEIRCHRDLSDGSVQIVRFDLPPDPVTSAAVATYVDEHASQRGSYGRAFRRMMNDMIFPDAYPAYGTVKADEADNLWFADYQRLGVEDVGWRVFDGDGALLGHVEMPEGLRVFRIYDDAILGVWRDSLDVEHVRMHALIK